jgi:hypothetical protein
MVENVRDLSLLKLEGLLISNHRNDTCPSCRAPSTSARFSFQIQGIITHVDSKRSKPRSRVFSTTGWEEDRHRDEITPFGGAVPARNAGNVPFQELGDEEDDAEDDEDEEEEEEEQEGQPYIAPIVPTTGSLVFPCLSCPPNNPTGYVCPIPIPAPTPEQIAAEQERVGPEFSVEPPVRGRGINQMTVEAARAYNTWVILRSMWQNT